MSRALLLIGSPKRGTSASGAFADAVSSRLDSRDIQTRTERITPAFSAPERMRALLDAIAESDLVVLAFPVYVDSLPAPVLALLEAWHAAVADGSIAANLPARLAVLTLCGFPEASHCDVAIEVCRLFAERPGLWGQARWRSAWAHQSNAGWSARRSLDASTRSTPPSTRSRREGRFPPRQPPSSRAHSPLRGRTRFSAASAGRCRRANRVATSR